MIYENARGGSKRIPRKNIKEFNGKPIMVGDIIPLELAKLKYQLLLPG